MSIAVRFVLVALIAFSLPSVAAASPAATHQEALRQIEALETGLADDRTAVASYDRQITSVGASLSLAQETIAQIERDRERKQEIMGDRLRAIYRFHGERALLALLEADDFGDFLARIGSLIRISQADARLVRSLKSGEDSYRDFASRLSLLQEELVELRRDRFVVLRRTEEQLAAGRTLLEQLNAELALQPRELATAAVSDTFFGGASWYGNQFHGRRTANGEIYDQDGFTAASPWLAFGTLVRVTYAGKQVVVRINDRGPFVKGRVLDLSRAAAQYLGLGVGYVRVDILDPDPSLHDARTGPPRHNAPPEAVTVTHSSPDGGS